MILYLKIIIPNLNKQFLIRVEVYLNDIPAISAENVLNTGDFFGLIEYVTILESRFASIARLTIAKSDANLIQIRILDLTDF